MSVNHERGNLDRWSTTTHAVKMYNVGESGCASVANGSYILSHTRAQIARVPWENDPGSPWESVSIEKSVGRFPPGGTHREKIPREETPRKVQRTWASDPTSSSCSYVFIKSYVINKIYFFSKLKKKEGKQTASCRLISSFVAWYFSFDWEPKSKNVRHNCTSSEMLTFFSQARDLISLLFLALLRSIFDIKYLYNKISNWIVKYSYFFFYIDVRELIYRFWYCIRIHFDRISAWNRIKRGFSGTLSSHRWFGRFRKVSAAGNTVTIDDAEA